MNAKSDEPRSFRMPWDEPTRHDVILFALKNGWPHAPIVEPADGWPVINVSDVLARLADEVEMALSAWEAARTSGTQ